MTLESVFDRELVGVQTAHPQTQDWWRDLSGTVTVTDRLTDVREAWRALEIQGVDSPGQSYDVAAAWIETFGLKPTDLVFVAGSDGTQPVILLPLKRETRFGVRMLTWLTGRHVGCDGPLVDRARLEAMGEKAREGLWRRVFAQLARADLVYLPHMLAPVGVERDLLAGFDVFNEGCTLYRAEFADWPSCDQSQRNRSRRKHDKQHTAKLTALGEVRCETLTGADDFEPLLATMFAQRAARFAQQGIVNPFADDKVQAFYRRAFLGGGSSRGVAQALKLNGETIAVRYNLVHGDRMFCLISSMSAAPEIQVGAPGKQCLLRVMQTVFDEGYTMFDMGAGLTDEKRVWCNRQLPLRTGYVALNWRGRAFMQFDRWRQMLKRRIKANTALFESLRKLRARLGGA